VLRVLVLVPYYGGSHRAWAEGYVRASRHEVSLVTLPARFWKWRMQGGAVTLATEVVARGLHPDVIVATDMVNLPAFLGLTRRHLGQVPVLLYCHENQLTYPLQPGEKRDLTYAMINWLSMLAADRVCFNSRFHLEDWFGALPGLLKHFPDCSHLPKIPEVFARSEVLPVGCTLRELLDTASSVSEANEPPLILWNQRWEYDKDPEAFFRALDTLVARGIAFRVALAGSNVRQQPEEFEAARERLGARVVHFGYADFATYRRLLWEADVVVSTARHEFFGVAVVEAITCATFPILPRRLSYPELIPPSFHDQCLYTAPEELVSHLVWALTHRTEAHEVALGLRPAMLRFDWTEVAPRYDELLEEVAATAPV